MSSLQNIPPEAGTGEMLNMYLENVSGNGEVEVIEYNSSHTEALIRFAELMFG